MSAETNYSAVIVPPRSGCVQRVSANTTAATTAFDADLLKRYVRIRAISGDVYFLVGGAAVTVDATATSGATLGMFLAAGESWYLRLAEGDSHIACDCASGTAEVELVAVGR